MADSEQSLLYHTVSLVKFQSTFSNSHKTNEIFAEYTMYTEHILEDALHWAFKWVELSCYKYLGVKEEESITVLEGGILSLVVIKIIMWMVHGTLLQLK